MFNFDGKAKSGRNINLGGSSNRQSATDVLEAAQKRRPQREQDRLRRNAATAIQKLWRAGKDLKLSGEKLMEEIDQLVNNNSPLKLEPSKTIRLIRIAAVFVRDRERLVRVGLCLHENWPSTISLLDSIEYSLVHLFKVFWLSYDGQTAVFDDVFKMLWTSPNLSRKVIKRLVNERIWYRQIRYIYMKKVVSLNSILDLINKPLSLYSLLGIPLFRLH